VFLRALKPRAGTDARRSGTVGQSEGRNRVSRPRRGRRTSLRNTAKTGPATYDLYNKGFEYLEEIWEGFGNAADVVDRGSAFGRKACYNHGHGCPVIAVTLDSCAG
jgi:hypothetical protein